MKRLLPTAFYAIHYFKYSLLREAASFRRERSSRLGFKHEQTTNMTKLIPRDEAKQHMLWKDLLRQEFDSFGVSLDELRNEYDDMIQNFEFQKSYLKDYVPIEKAILEREAIRTPSPTPSTSSQNSFKKKKKPLSASGLQSSFRHARNSLRRKISVHNFTSGDAKNNKNRSSVMSLTKPESESFELESAEVY